MNSCRRGTQHAVIKLAVETMDSPAVLNFARFSIAAVLCAPQLPLSRELLTPLGCSGEDNVSGDSLQQRRESAFATWRAGLELSIWMFLGYAFQAVGLETTSASRSCFLLYLNVKLVPIFSSIFLAREIPFPTWVSAATALLGTALVANDGSPPVIGDAWSLAAAVASAIFILRLEALAPKYDPRELNATSLASVAVLCAFWFLFGALLDTAGSDIAPEINQSYKLLSTYISPNIIQSILSMWFDNTSELPRIPATLMEQLSAASSHVFAETKDLLITSGPAVLYLSVVTTALCNWLQTIGQARVGAEQAALIYALDPVWGALFARVLCGEELGAQGIFGGVLIVAAALGSQLTNPPKPDFSGETER